MVKYEVKEINGKQYDYHYSDEGYLIEREGVLYTDALDPLNSDREYTETDIKIEIKEDNNEEENS